MSYSSGFAAGLLAVAISGVANAQDVPPGVVMFNAAKAQWTTTSMAGNPQAKIIGDDQKPGPYVLFARPRPLGAKSPAAQPHTHPDERTYTIVSGTWYVGFGDKYDESKLIALPAGSFYTEPAGVPHFVVIKDEGVTVKITGTGPSKIIPVQKK
jgi:mannose-6-phosphate isomerase-like protein (cupin superfamily)